MSIQQTRKALGLIGLVLMMSLKILATPTPLITSVSPPFGFSGTRVVLEGAALQEAQIAFIGQGGLAVAEVIARDGDTRVTVKAPPNPQPRPGLVSIKAVSDSLESNEVAFLYLAEHVPAPSLDHLSHRCAMLGYEGTMTISGADFGSNPAVSMGGQPAQVVVSSPFLLQVSVPPGKQAGDVDLEVFNPESGKRTTWSRAFRYLEPTPPNITQVNPDPASVFLAVTIQGAGFIPGSTRVAMGGRELPADQISVDPCGQLVAQIPEGVVGSVALSVTTELGEARRDIQVTAATLEDAGCAYSVFRGRRVDEPPSSAFYRGEYGAGRVFLRAHPQCLPPIHHPELRFRLNGAPSFPPNPAGDCDPTVCLMGQARAYQVPVLGPFEAPRDLDIQIKCSNGVTREEFNFFTLYVKPRQDTERFTIPDIINPGGEVTIKVNDLLQPGRPDGLPELVAPQRIILYAREGRPDGSHVIVWSTEFNPDQMCVAPQTCPDRPVRIEPDASDPARRLHRVTARVPNVPNIIGRDVFISLIAERSECSRVDVDQGAFPTLLFHVRAPGSFDLRVQPDETPIHFTPNDPNGTTRTKTVQIVRRGGPDRYAGDVRVEATLESSVTLNLSLSLTGGREEEYCRPPRCAVIYFSPQAPNAELTLSVRKTGALPPGTTRATLRIRATYPPRGSQFTQEKLIDLYVSPLLGLLPSSGALTQGRVAVAYDDRSIQAQGGAAGYRWYFCNSAVASPPVPANCLPNGLTIQLLESNSRVRIYGTPTLEQTKTFPVKVRDQAGQERTATYTITVKRAYVESFVVQPPLARSVNTACGSPAAELYTIRLTTRNFDRIPAGQRTINLAVLQPSDPSITLSQDSLTAPDSGSVDITLTVPSGFIAGHPSTAWNIIVQASGPLVPATTTNPSGSLTINPSRRSCSPPNCICVEGDGVDQCSQIGGSCRFICRQGSPSCEAYEGPPGSFYECSGPSSTRCSCLDDAQSYLTSCLLGCPCLDHPKNCLRCELDCGAQYDRLTGQCPAQ